MKTRNLIFKCVKEFEMYIRYDILHNNYEDVQFTKRLNNKEMLSLILEESEHHMPFTVEQKELLEKVNKKLVKYGLDIWNCWNNTVNGNFKLKEPSQWGKLS